MDKNTKTFILIKPDAVERELVSQIIERFIEKGFIVDKMDCLYAQNEKIEKMYADNISINGECYAVNIKKYLENKIVIPIQFSFNGEGDAIKVARKLTGYFDPANAEKGSIRCDYGVDSLSRAMKEDRCCYNLVHAASSYDEYILDVGIWFSDFEQHNL